MCSAQILQLKGIDYEWWFWGRSGGNFFSLIWGRDFVLGGWGSFGHIREMLCCRSSARRAWRLFYLVITLGKLTTACAPQALVCMDFGWHLEFLVNAMNGEVQGDQWRLGSHCCWARLCRWCYSSRFELELWAFFTITAALHCRECEISIAAVEFITWILEWTFREWLVEERSTYTF